MTDRLLETLYWPAWITYASTGVVICATLVVADGVRKAVSSVT